MTKPHRHHHLRLFIRRGLQSLALVSALLVIGTVAIHHFEHMAWLDAFYFVSMLATAQGPALVPQTPAGKLFSAAFAFISVGSVLTSLGYLCGPFVAQLWHWEIEKLENRK